MKQELAKTFGKLASHSSGGPASGGDVVLQLAATKMSAFSPRGTGKLVIGRYMAPQPFLLGMYMAHIEVPHPGR